MEPTQYTQLKSRYFPCEYFNGVSPDRGNYLSNPSFESLDTVLISAMDSGYETAYFGNHIPTPPEEENTPAMSESIEAIELTITASYVEPIQYVSDIISWLDQYGDQLQSYNFIILTFPFSPFPNKPIPTNTYRKLAL